MIEHKMALLELTPGGLLLAGSFFLLFGFGFYVGNQAVGDFYQAILGDRRARSMGISPNAKGNYPLFMAVGVVLSCVGLAALIGMAFQVSA